MWRFVLGRAGSIEPGGDLPGPALAKPQNVLRGLMEASPLRLLADDPEDLGIIAAAVQDALSRPQDIRFDQKARTFGLELSRFQWERAGGKPPYFRARSVLAFSGVLGVRSRGMPRGVDDVLGLLDLRFAPGPEAPGGTVTLMFAQGPAVELDVECLDVTLIDTGVTWPTRRKPDHEATT